MENGHSLCLFFFVIKSFIILLTDVLYDANNQLTANIHIKWLASTATYKMEQIFTVNMYPLMASSEYIL